jgi:hypothetical protein
MGKSIDLPDPLESASSQPLGNADDLLAQLAGEEVDRLLAEADEEGKRHAKPGEARRSADAPHADLSAAVTGPPPAAAAIQDQLDALFTEITAEQPSPEPAPAQEPSSPSAAPRAFSEPSVAPIAPEPFTGMRSKLPDDINADEVMAAILGDPPSTPRTPAAPTIDPAPAPATSPGATPTSALATLAPAAKSTELATSAAERHALTHHDPADELPGPGELEALAGPIHADDDGPLPVYLKPLEWMNAPLEMLPTTARDVLGQLAILTLVNAIAVLIYVFVFRRP